MPERRPFPPSPRRRALARAAGLTAASPLLVAAAALGAAAATSAILARDAVHTLGVWLAAACDGHASLTAAALPRAIATLAAPLLGLAAVAALAAHLAQTRGIWLPRRRIEGAPAAPRRTGLLDLLAAIVVGTTAFAWLWLTAPRIAALVTAPPAQAALAVAAFVATLAIAIVVLGTLDALLRHAALGNAFAMTAEEKRQDERLSAADPRWRARRLEQARGDARAFARTNRASMYSARTGSARTDSARSDRARADRTGTNRPPRDVPDARELIATASLLLVGDDVAVAIAYDPVRHPTPARIAVGTGPAATQLLAHARRQALPIHRDAPLASAIAADARATAPTHERAHERAIAEAHWPRLAEIIAATRGR